MGVLAEAFAMSFPVIPSSEQVFVATKPPSSSKLALAVIFTGVITVSVMSFVGNSPFSTDDDPSYAVTLRWKPKLPNSNQRKPISSKRHLIKQPE